MIANEGYDKTKVAESIAALWQPLTDEQRQYLVDNIEVRVLDKNETLYEEDDLPEYIMCLLQGKIKVYKNGIGGHPQIIRVISRMGLFGYRAAFVNECYQASAAAFEPSVVCMMPIDVVKSLIKANNRLAIFFIKQLSTMLGDADTLTVNLTQKHIRARLAEAIIVLKDKYGVEDDGSTLAIYLSREDLANMSSMTTSNAIRTLSALAQENIIAIDGRKIKVIDEKGLRRISEIG